MAVGDKILKVIATAIVLFIVYLIASASIAYRDIVYGIVFSVAVALITAELLISKATKPYNVVRWFWAVAYAIYYLTVAEFKAHSDVIMRILHPDMPIKPGIVRVPYHVETDYATVTIANSITNTPGTVVVDLDTKRKCFYVHWINVKAPDEKTTFENISKYFEYFAKRIFD